MNVIVFRHFDFDDPAALELWAQEGGHKLDICHPSNGILEKWLETMELLIILGGPMSVYQESDHPWLVEEKEFVRKAIERGTKVLGICLGAQMIADVLGGAVSRNREKEIGWHLMQRTDERHPWLDGLPESFVSYSWHGDTYTLPAGARRLAYSEACGEQAFAYGDHVLALQFHLETTPDCIEQMLIRWSDELQDKPYIQHETVIRAGMENSVQAQLMLNRILNRISFVSAKQ
ncbi:type 1 glutamine amidotransferase [Paenibacillus sp. strain BS8-2]